MLNTLAELAEPRTAAAECLRAGTELARIAFGASDVAPDVDHRFTDPAWRLNPLYRRWAQAYVVWKHMLERLAAAGQSDADWRRAERARYAATLLADALAPTNTLAGNPAALKRAFDTGGASGVRGVRNAVRDLARNRGLPQQVDRGSYRVRESLAATPGAVIYRDELSELIQYAPAGARVSAVPLLMVPPQVNKHYFLDLAPGRSLTEYLVSRGLQYFTMVWRSPSGEDGARGIDGYVAAQLRAIDVVREVTGADTLNLLGVCAGGLTSALMLGHLAAAGEADAIASATFAISMIDGRHPNPFGMLGTEEMQRRVARDAAAGRVYDRRTIGRTFAWLRPDDLVFNYVVNDWLMGDDPPAFDILAWNDDGSDLPARFFAQMLDIYVHNRAAEPGAVSVLDTPVDLGRVTCDTFVVCGLRDHITPWQCGYETSRLLGGRSEVVVASGGHIQTMVNPPGKARGRYFATSGRGSTRTARRVRVPSPDPGRGRGRSRACPPPRSTRVRGGRATPSGCW